MSPDVFTALYDAHAPALYRFLLSLSGSEADTRDLLQDLFVKMARQPEKTLTHPQAWLLRAGRNLYIDYVRRNAHRREVMARYEGDMRSALPEPDSTVASPHSPLAIAHALSGLPEEQRAVVHLKIWESLTFAAISGILDIPANTAASRYRYAMARLRRTLTDNSACHES